MGICNSSTKEDVRQDRERTRGAQQARPSQAQLQAQAAHEQQQAQAAAANIPRPGQHGSSMMGIPTGSYRDAAGVSRSIALDQPIGQSYRGEEDGSMGAYGTSYTNRKTREYDLLHDIVKQTQHNFIDVSAKSGLLDDDELLERGHKYVKHLSDLPAPPFLSLHSQPGGVGKPYYATAMAPATMGRYYNSMQLPQPSSIIVQHTGAAPAGGSALSHGLAAHAPAASAVQVDWGALLRILATAHIPQQDVEFVSVSAAHLSSLMQEGSVVHEPAPKIVLSFEELLNDK